jgi:hypothetical protein
MNSGKVEGAAALPQTNSAKQAREMIKAEAVVTLMRSGGLG